MQCSGMIDCTLEDYVPRMVAISQVENQPAIIDSIEFDSETSKGFENELFFGSNNGA